MLDQNNIATMLLLLLLLLLLRFLTIPGGLKALRYTDESRPPWLPADYTWNKDLILKAKQSELELFYHACRGALWELKREELRKGNI